MESVQVLVVEGNTLLMSHSTTSGAASPSEHDFIAFSLTAPPPTCLIWRELKKQFRTILLDRLIKTGKLGHHIKVAATIDSPKIYKQCLGNTTNLRIPSIVNGHDK